MRAARTARVPRSDAPSVPQISSAKPDDPGLTGSPDFAAWRVLFGSTAPERLAPLVARAVAWKQQVAQSSDVSRAIREDLRLIAQEIKASRLPIGRHDATERPKNAVKSGQITRLGKASCTKPAPLPPAASVLLPGTRLVKAHGGRNHVVEVLETGFRYEGRAFSSLSAIAKAITGTHWNGLLFFGLRRRKTYPKKVPH